MRPRTSTTFTTPSSLPITRSEEKAPNAKGHIYVLGYPDIFGTSAFLNGSCVPQTGMGAGSISWLYGVEQQLNTVVQDAAEKAGVHYVNPNKSGASYSFVGHDICATDSWFHPLYANLGNHAFSFHPTTTGQSEMAAALVAAGATKVNIGGAADIASSPPREPATKPVTSAAPRPLMTRMMPRSASTVAKRPTDHSPTSWLMPTTPPATS